MIRRCVKEVTDGVFASLFYVRARLGNGNNNSSIVKVIVICWLCHSPLLHPSLRMAGLPFCLQLDMAMRT